MEVFLGKEGVTTTVLRPAGMAEFDGVKLNVVADGEYIPKDARVRVDIRALHARRGEGGQARLSNKEESS